jgi:hypothetical protein
MAASAMSLHQVLGLVGELDDAPGDDTPRERFRQVFLDRVADVGTLRDYVEECLRTTGTNYSRALQDLVNRLGTFLGFEVTYGRYQGVLGQVGHDGLWRSPSGLHVVVEIKTTDAYAIKTSTLMGYIGALISAQEIPTKRDALGLYVVGRLDAELRQLENAIAAEGRTDELRIVTVASLLDLADLMQQYDVDHEDVLTVLKPSGPRVDPVVDLLSRLVGQDQAGKVADDYAEDKETASATTAEVTPAAGGSPDHWISPVKDLDEEPALDGIRRLVGDHHLYAYGDRTPGRKRLKPGDWICFYASGTGVVGHAQVASFPERKPSQYVHDQERYPWTFSLRDVSLYLDRPIVIDAALRATLDAFEGRDPAGHWSWLVQGTRHLTRHDFRVLTGQGA